MSNTGPSAAFGNRFLFSLPFTEYNAAMSPASTVPRWLGRAANLALVAALLAVAGGAVALALGLADPPRAGPARWHDDFKAGLARWSFQSPRGGLTDTDAGALAFTLPAPEAATPAIAWALTPGPSGDFTLEVAGAAAAGSGQAAYGLVFGWQDADHFQAVLVNGDGYAQAYTQAGAERTTWFAFQQWPHILYGTDSNRVRVDLRGSTVTARINDEVLATTTLTSVRGQIGVLVSSPAAARVVFSWARVWGQP